MRRAVRCPWVLALGLALSMQFVLGGVPQLAGSDETGHETTGRSPKDACVCADAKRDHGWCDACGVGYVAGVPIRSRYLWEVLDAHGHSLNLERLTHCTEAVRSNGYCEDSKIGFVDGKAYFSRLTWLLARAERKELESLDCPVCRKNYEHSGWCERCGSGRVGPYTLYEREDYDALVQDLQILAAANEAAEHCEQCAAAIVTDTQCPVCRIRYKDGKPEPATPRESVGL